MLSKELVKRLPHRQIRGDLDREVSGLCFDSRHVSSGDAFVCIAGEFFDSHTVLAEIVSADPALVVVENNRLPEDLDAILARAERTAVIAVDDTRAAKAVIAAAYYDYPSEKLTVIGITGSKGKTTTASMVAAILSEAGQRVGVIGSNGILMDGEETEVANTTPDAPELQRYLAEMVRRDYRYAVIECSSQGLMQHRTDMIDFAIGIFLNIQRGDHVGENEHPTFENYMYCKGLLLKQCQLAIVNADDPHLDFVLQGVETPLLSFGHGNTTDYRISDEETYRTDGIAGERFRLSGRCSTEIAVGLPGDFAAINATAAIAATYELGIPRDAAHRALAKIHISGRLDMIYRSPALSVCIDSAHTRDSTRGVLTALRAYEPKRLVCVFGAGGNRDMGRRIGMGESAGKYADFTIITTEHNRFEPFETILAGIRQGIDPTGGPYCVIENRKEAIRHAILHSQEGDLVAVIGLGHDKYQHIAGKNVPQDDEACALAAIEEWNTARQAESAEEGHTHDQI